MIVLKWVFIALLLHIPVSAAVMALAPRDKLLPDCVRHPVDTARSTPEYVRRPFATVRTAGDLFALAGKGGDRA